MREVDQALARGYAAAAARPAGSPPRPHFPVERPSAPGLLWPETVKALERAHGDRFERLADAVVEARERRSIKSLLFTSCHRAEGRTTLVLTLARALARRPGRTLLVDGDLAGPMLARQLGLRPICGLAEVLERGLAAAEAVVESADDHLSLLPLLAAVDRPRELLAGPGWASLMAKLRREYDSVLIDGGPLFSGLSAAVLHRGVDAAVLVHNRALTGRRALDRAREVLEAGGVPLLGLAETFA